MCSSELDKKGAMQLKASGSEQRSLKAVGVVTSNRPLLQSDCIGYASSGKTTSNIGLKHRTTSIKPCCVNTAGISYDGAWL